jgi:hypothetical protein
MSSFPREPGKFFYALMRRQLRRYLITKEAFHVRSKEGMRQTQGTPRQAAGLLPRADPKMPWPRQEAPLRRDAEEKVAG